MRRCRPDGVVVAAGEAAQHVRQRQEQPYRRPHDHVRPEQPAPLEYLRRISGAAATGLRRRREDEAGEGDEVGGGEGREEEVEEGDEAGGGEDHDERHKLQLDHTEGTHHAA